MEYYVDTKTFFVLDCGFLDFEGKPAPVEAVATFHLYDDAYKYATAHQKDSIPLVIVKVVERLGKL